MKINNAKKIWCSFDILNQKNLYLSKKKNVQVCVLHYNKNSSDFNIFSVTISIVNKQTWVVAQSNDR